MILKYNKNKIGGVSLMGVVIFFIAFILISFSVASLSYSQYIKVKASDNLVHIISEPNISNKKITLNLSEKSNFLNSINDLLSSKDKINKNAINSISLNKIKTGLDDVTYIDLDISGSNKIPRETLSDICRLLKELPLINEAWYLDDDTQTIVISSGKTRSTFSDILARVETQKNDQPWTVDSSNDTINSTVVISPPIINEDEDVNEGDNNGNDDGGDDNNGDDGNSNTDNNGDNNNEDYSNQDLGEIIAQDNQGPNGSPCIDLYEGGIAAYNINCTKKDIIIPGNIGNKNVKGIRVGGFRNKQLTSITLPSYNLEHIGDGAFEGNNLGNISIPNNIKTIGKDAFKNNQIKQLTLRTNLQSIGDNAFSGNNFDKVEFSNDQGLLNITGNIFTNSTIKNLIIGGLVNSVGDSVFKDKDIKNLTLKEGTKIIGEFAFEGNNIENLNLPGSITTIGDYAFRGNKLIKISKNWSSVNLGIDVFKNNGPSSNSNNLSDNWQISSSGTWNLIGFNWVKK